MTAPLYPSEDLRKRLVELGVPRDKHNLAELGEMLPDYIDEWQFYISKAKNNWWVEYMDLVNDKTECLRSLSAETFANAMAKMLIYLLEKGLMK